VFQYIIPILLFGNVVPFTHGTVRAGLTVAGYIAGGIMLFIVMNKAKEWLHSKPKSLARGITLSLFPIAIWFVINIGLNGVYNFLISFIKYWHYIIIFIIIGRIFYIADEAMCEKETKNLTNETK
jgi:hypothetical protein